MDEYTNRLIHEKSPYLQQHAHNPVDWYPWGEEAFSAARALDRPILLSIGYTTCHWCHVMERESFMNAAVAEKLNDTFINIKVDREELPAVDSLYMEFAQSMISGSAGWPLNVVLTPELKPFFASTYLPPTRRKGMIGVIELCERIKTIWGSEEKEMALEQANSIYKVFSEINQEKGEEIPSLGLIDEAVDLLYRISDPIYGGNKGAPKFPLAYQQTFLITHSMRTQDARALFIAERTLERMYQGGIYDHLDGGFSRYAVDERWLIPHFEKMLYDNALLLEAYATAYLATKRELYRKVAFETARYVLEIMTAPEGCFYAAEDSENEGQEGLFYTWLYGDIVSTLGEEHEVFCEFYNITPQGNFHGRNILNVPQLLPEFAQRKNVRAETLSERIELQKELLRKVRSTFPRPFRDEKVLTAWNGLMIHSMAYAGALLGEPLLLDAAERAAEFFYRQPGLYRRTIQGEGKFSPSLEDYAFLIRGLITLFEAGRGTKWLGWALKLTEHLKENFKAEGRAFYQTDGKDPNLILRSMQFSDGSEPSGNAVHTENLLRLYQLTLDQNYLAQAEDVLQNVEYLLSTYAPGYIFHLANLAWYHDPAPRTVVIALNSSNEHRHEIEEALRRSYKPHRVILWRSEGDTELNKLLPFAAHQGPIDGKTTVYICSKGVCHEPLTDLEEIIAAL